MNAQLLTLISRKRTRSPDLRSKSTKEVIWIQNWLNPAWLKAGLASMSHGPVESDDGRNVEGHHGAPRRKYNRMTGPNPPQVLVGHETRGRGSISTMTTALERGPREGVNNISTGTCWDARTLCKAGRPKEVLHILNQRGVRADSETYVCLLQECINMKDLEEGKQVHNHILHSGFKPDIFLLNTIVNMYTKCRSLVDARHVFDQMPERTLITWNIMIAGYARHGCGREAFKFYKQMQWEGVTPDRVTFICVLNACASLGALEMGREVHADIIRVGITSCITLENTLVGMYAKCASMKDAHQVFDCMAKRDVVSWNVMIARYAQHGCSREAFKIYERMQGEGVMPDRVTFISVLSACASLGALEKGKAVHADIIKAGVLSYINLQNTLLDMYAKCGSMKDSRQVFDNMAKRDVVSWNAMIAGYAQRGCNREAFNLYEVMQQEGITPDKVTFICVLNACANAESLEKGKEIHTDIMTAGITSDMILETALAAMYAKCGSMKDACQVFNHMATRNVVSWTTMIAGYALHGCGKEALEMYEQMQQDGMKPDRVMFISVLNACASLGALQKGREVHAAIIRTGIPSYLNLENSLIDMYAKCRNMKSARQVFDNMTRRDVISWNAMITGYAEDGCGREALRMYEEMQSEEVTPDMVTYTCVLNACASLGALEKGKQVHADIIITGISSYVNLENALVDMYAKCGRMNYAHQVFNNIAQRNVVSWNTMIAGYAQQGCGREACQIYKEMQREGVMPDGITLVCILNVCARLGALEKGKEVHCDAIEAGIASYINLENTLIDMYSKCGSMKDAREVFDNMAQRDSISWSAMIAGCAQHGCGREALQLFEQMQLQGLKPDGITLTSILSACSRVGLVDEGCHYFGFMSRKLGLSPTVEHFSCMVDLLGRAGRLDEAEDIIRKMPIEPDPGVWGALLGACRMHGKVELAECVAKRHMTLGHT